MNIYDASALFFMKRRLDHKGYAPSVVRNLLAHYRVFGDVIDGLLAA